MRKESMNKKRRHRRLRKDRIFFLLILPFLLYGIFTIASVPEDVKGSSSEIDTKTTKNENSAKAKIVMLDAGHGGFDSGTQNGKYNEKVITLAITKQIGNYLVQMGFDVRYTRERDQALGKDEEEDLSTRVQLMRQSFADLFVSIHLNSTSLKEGCYGFEIFYNAQAEKLAFQTEKQLAAIEYTYNRGSIPDESLYVLRSIKKPAILIEAGFMNDEEDLQYLTSSEGQARIAKAIAQGITKTIQ